MLSLATELSRIEKSIRGDAAFTRDAAALKRESRKITDAGVILARPRAEMRHAELIRDRMVDDLEDLNKRRDLVGLYDLTEVGWPYTTIERLGGAAVLAFRAMSRFTVA